MTSEMGSFFTQIMRILFMTPTIFPGHYASRKFNLKLNICRVLFSFLRRRQTLKEIFSPVLQFKTLEIFFVLLGNRLNRLGL